jgi:hypothetical protein
MKAFAKSNFNLLILFLILTLLTGLVEAIMGPRIAFSAIKRFGSKRNGLIRTPSSNTMKTYAKAPSTKVVTDIDDTVKSSGGVKLFGIPLGGIDVSNIISISKSSNLF